MLETFFHAWERRLASVTKDHVVRPFDWGLDWIQENGLRGDQPPAAVIEEWVSHVMKDTDAFSTPPPTTEYQLEAETPIGERMLTFPSALETPHPENNIVPCRIFPARSD